MGPFDLLAPAGRGGMGVVYRARHRADQHDVAIKLLSGDVDETALHREIEATAALAHPGIVAVYDSGRVPDDVSGPDLVPGAPYFVMEYLPGGSLGEAAPSMRWPALRHTLLAVLDALAHAHARDVLHLDLKPGNILRHTHGAWRLVDFGISHLVTKEGRVMGTPAYMAPEQLRGDFGRLGPGTDLYAIGVLGWVLVTGGFPRDGTPQEILSRALAGSLPAFRPRLAVPPALEDWLRLLMSAGVEDRPATAADAARALAALPGSAPDDPPLVAAAMDTSATFTLDPVTLALDRVPTVAPSAPPASPTTQPPQGLPRRFSRPPHRVAPPSNLGLGLFAVRPLPFVGREEEVDLLWEQLVQVSDHSQVRVAAIVGRPGVGKTRLAREIVLRARELGAVRALAVEPPDASVDAILDALGTFPPPLDTPEAEAWERWSRGGDLAVGDRAALAAGAIRRASEVRPVLLHIDDVGELPQVLEVVARLADGPPAPVFVLMTAQVLPDIALDATIHLEGLPTSALRRVLQLVLGLEPDSALELAREADGRPRYLSNLLAFWVERGRLRPGAEGYELVPGEELEPKTRTLQIARLVRWLGSRPSDRWRALELAALLGIATRTAELDAAWSRAGVGLDGDTISAGVRAGLLRERPDAFAFADADLRETVIAGIPQGARTELHRIAASVIDEADADRRARHHRAAGMLEEAAKDAGVAAMRANALGDLKVAIHLFDLRVQLLRELQADPATIGHALGWLAWCNYRESHFELGAEQARETLAIGEELGDDYLVGSGLHTLGVIARGRFEPNPGELLRAAADAYERAGDVSMAVQARMASFQTDPAHPDLLTAVDALAARLDSEVVRAFALLRKTEILYRLGRYDEALEVGRDARDRFERGGYLDRAHHTERVLAVVHVERGELTEALDAFDRSRRLLVDDMSHVARSLDMQQGLVALLAGRVHEGARAVRNHAEWFEQHPWGFLLMICRVGLATAAAVDADRVAWDAACRGAHEILEHVKVQPLYPLHLNIELAVEAWEANGDLERAAQARALLERIRSLPR